MKQSLISRQSNSENNVHNLRVTNTSNSVWMDISTKPLVHMAVNQRITLSNSILPISFIIQNIILMLQSTYQKCQKKFHKQQKARVHRTQNQNKILRKIHWSWRNDNWMKNYDSTNWVQHPWDRKHKLQTQANPQICWVMMGNSSSPKTPVRMIPNSSNPLLQSI